MERAAVAELEDEADRRREDADPAQLDDVLVRDVPEQRRLFQEGLHLLRVDVRAVEHLAWARVTLGRL